MFPKINNKSLMECSAADFEVLIQNPDYRESQYLDFKEDFAFLRAPKDKAASKIIEFRNDICSFANTDGGYIIYGIRDDQGTAAELVGVEVANPDKFELDLRNKLTPIMPKVPPIQFRFVELSNRGYLVLILIDHDYYAPYMHLEDQKNYKIYKRDGNQKTVIGYIELKNMFIQSRVLEDEILNFRNKRIEYFKSIGGKKYERFVLFHMIPESFLNDRKQLFIQEQRTHQYFRAVFSGTKIDSKSLPCVDGLRYLSTDGDDEAILYNNGIAEFVLPLTIYVAKISEGLFFYSDEIWTVIDQVAQGYKNMMPELFGNQRYYGCVSIIGCRGVISEHNGTGRAATLIDRDNIVCEPIAFSDVENKDVFYDDLKKLHIEFLLSLGIRRNDLIREMVES